LTQGVSVGFLGCLVGVLVRLRRFVGPGLWSHRGTPGYLRRWFFARCWLRIRRGGGGEAVAVGVDQPPSAVSLLK